MDNYWGSEAYYWGVIMITVGLGKTNNLAQFWKCEGLGISGVPVVQI